MSTPKSSSAALLLLLLLLLVSAAHGGRVSQPDVVFVNTCPSISFNYLYQKYQLQLPVSVDTSRWRLGHRLTKLEVSADPEVRKSGVAVVANADDSHAGTVSLLCNSFQRCNELMTQVTSDPHSIAAALRFRVVAQKGRKERRSLFVAPGSMSGTTVSAGCNKGWVVFQQRVDGSLSFRQNYNSYVRGFGNPNGNYWMGLNNLHNSLRAGTSYLPCRLRIEVTTVSGKKFWGEWKHFFVDEAAAGFLLRVSSPVKGSQITSSAVTYHSGRRFSTYDRDRDAWRNNCSKYYGYGGWWYKACHYVNLNGEYPTAGQPHHPAFACINFRNGKRRGNQRYRRMKLTKMMFKCEAGSSSSSSSNSQ